MSGDLPTHALTKANRDTLEGWLLLKLGQARTSFAKAGMHHSMCVCVCVCVRVTLNCRRLSFVLGGVLFGFGFVGMR